MRENGIHAERVGARRQPQHSGVQYEVVVAVEDHRPAVAVRQCPQQQARVLGSDDPVPDPGEVLEQGLSNLQDIVLPESLGGEALHAAKGGGQQDSDREPAADGQGR